MIVPWCSGEYLVAQSPMSETVTLALGRIWKRGGFAGGTSVLPLPCGTSRWLRPEVVT